MRIRGTSPWTRRFFAPKKFRILSSAEYLAIQKITPIPAAIVMAEPIALPILSDSRFPMHSDR